MDFVKLQHKEIQTKINSAMFVAMPLEIYQELIAYVTHYKTEVSGCGLIEMQQNKDQIGFYIKEVFLPDKQDNSSAATDIDDKEIHALINKLITENKDPSQLRLHWHSHADMGVFHSGTDEDNYKTLLKGNWRVSLVINHAKEILARVDFADPFQISISSIPVLITFEDNLNTKLRIDENIAKLDKYVKDNEKKPVVYSKSYGYTGANNYTTRPLKWYEEEELEERKLKHKIRSKLGISKKKARVYENCTTCGCEKCSDLKECQEYMFEIEDIYGKWEV